VDDRSYPSSISEEFDHKKNSNLSDGGDMSQRKKSRNISEVQDFDDKDDKVS
jgi:hypothetical protein